VSLPTDAGRLPLRVFRRALIVVALAGLALFCSSTAAFAGDAGKPDGSPTASSNAETEFVRRRNERIKLLPAVAAPPQVSGPMSNPIDQFIVAAWSKAAFTPSSSMPEVCDDATFARRGVSRSLGRRAHDHRIESVPG